MIRAFALIYEHKWCSILQGIAYQKGPIWYHIKTHISGIILKRELSEIIQKRTLHCIISKRDLSDIIPKQTYLASYPIGPICSHTQNGCNWHHIQKDLPDIISKGPIWYHIQKDLYGIISKRTYMVSYPKGPICHHIQKDLYDILWKKVHLILKGTYLVPHYKLPYIYYLHAPETRSSKGSNSEKVSWWTFDLLISIIQKCWSEIVLLKHGHFRSLLIVYELSFKESS